MISSATIERLLRTKYARAGGCDRPVRLRMFTMSGGDRSLGLPGTLTQTDVLLSPDVILERRFGPTDHLVTSGGLLRVGDLAFLIPQYRLDELGITVSILGDPQTRLLYGEDLLYIVDIEKAGIIDGRVVEWRVFARGITA